MPLTSLAEFIDKERVAIVAEWETFAGTLLPAAEPMSASALRDHADQILTAIVADMKSRQSRAEQTAKSKGHGDTSALTHVGQVHAAQRIESGFNLVQIVAEYRALRATVLRLWEKLGVDPPGVTRFNESIDEALSEGVDKFTATTQHFRDQSLGILGHDLRNPLSAIITGATLLTMSDSLDDKSVRIAARMLNSANRMGRMIGDLLDLTRTRFGDRIPVVRRPLDLEPLFRQVIAELEGHCLPGTIVFTPIGDLRGEWDGDRIAQVVSNLLANAIQHCAPGQPITIVAKDEGAAVLVTVHNGGPPISPEAQSTLFEPRVQHHDGGPASSGLGLGLYIVAQIVLAHDGHVDVSSDPNTGTKVSIRLPRLGS